MLVEISGLVHRFGAATVLDLPNWQVEAGAHQLVLGPSGSGKSTLLSALAGLLLPSAGGIRIEGQDVTALGAAARDRWRAQRIGLVMQRLHLIPAVTVRNNLRLAQSLAGRAVDDVRITSVLKSLGVAHKLNAKPAQLSVGEAQRIAIARAVLNRPALLLADEPTSALDDTACEAALNLLLAQASANQSTLIIATHDARLRPHFRHTLQLSARAPVAANA